MQHLSFLGPVFGTGFVAVTIFFLPGICGFLVWERDQAGQPPGPLPVEERRLLPTGGEVSCSLIS